MSRVLVLVLNFISLIYFNILFPHSIKGLILVFDSMFDLYILCL